MGCSDAVADDAATVDRDNQAECAALDDMTPLVEEIVAVSLEKFQHSHEHLQTTLSLVEQCSNTTKVARCQAATHHEFGANDERELYGIQDAKVSGSYRSLLEIGE
jgi:hypothetical protein